MVDYDAASEETCATHCKFRSQDWRKQLREQIAYGKSLRDDESTDGNRPDLAKKQLTSSKRYETDDEENAKELREAG